MRKTLFLVVLAIFLAACASGQSVNIAAPLANSTVPSAVHVVASANGGSSPATAMRIYVDNASVYTVQQPSLNTTLTMSPGKHYMSVVGWNSAGLGFSSSLYVNVASAGVSISSPGNGASVTSPVNFVASATATAGNTITAMRIYVDSASVYLTSNASLNTNISMGSGTHNVTVQAWDNAGAVYKTPMSVTVSGTGSGGSSGGAGNGTNAWGLTPPATSIAPYSTNFTATSNYLANTWIKPDGALYNTNFIRPYLGNLAALGLVKDPRRWGAVRAWMQWYIAHLNYGDKWGLSGTTYDYSVSNGVETSLNTNDSTDSYAATFLSLAWAYYQTGDPTAQSYIKSVSSQLDLIGGVIAATQQSDGLTWAQPDYLIKYLMDNCEVQRGLRDAVSLFNAIGLTSRASHYQSMAGANMQGINGMWMNGVWAVYKGYSGAIFGPDMSVWYADATAQLFPVLQGVVSASDSRAQQAYAAFNKAWPGWPQLSFTSQDAFPWILVSGAAAQMGDTARVSQYIQTIENQYVNVGFGGLFYDNEGGWFMRTNWYMQGGRPY
ncbi:MAG: hypothetical protein JO041_16445 [Acidobacteria bacterium]|nr:hypothetical protein [Acidobacteriota bacterium]